MSLIFTDTDIDGGQLAGDVVITKASDESDLTGYALYWGSSPSVKLNATPIATLVVTGSNLTYSFAADTALPIGATHLLVFTANAGGEMGTGVSTAIVDLALPDAPSGFSTSIGDGEVVVSWETAADVDSYNLYWDTVPGVTLETWTKIEQVTSPYTHSSLANGTTYYYLLTAVNSIGESSVSNLAIAAIHSGTAAIDGIFAPGEWDNAVSTDFQANLPSNDGGGTTAATLYVLSDTTNVYLALRIERASFGGATNPVFEFDNDNDGVNFEAGDDYILMAVGIFQSPEFTDGYRYPCEGAAAGTGGCSALDTDIFGGILPAGTSDGMAAASNDGTFTTIELSHPLDSGDVLHDISLNANDPISFMLGLRLFSLDPACNDCFADTSLSHRE